MEVSEQVKKYLIKYKEELKQGVSNFFAAVCAKEDDYYLYASEIIPFFCETLNCSPEYLLKGTDYIPEAMFYECDFSTFDIPDYITYIGGFAFYGCQNLREITISDSVSYSSIDAFGYCFNLTLKIDKNNQYAISYAKKHGIKYELY